MYEGVVDRKQFVLGRHSVLKKINFPSRFLFKDLGDNLCMAHCPDLPVLMVDNERGETILLVGTVVEADAGKPDPQDAIHQLGHQSIAELTESWTGHWVVIYKGNLYRDCCGLFPIYMPREPILEKVGDLIISNSPKPLVDFYKQKKINNIGKKIIPYPMPPSCHIPELRLLMAGEVLNIKNGVRNLPGIPVFHRYDVTEQEVREQVASYLVTSIRNLGKNSSRKISCALSGGYDSRLNFSAADAAGIEFDSFTFVKPYFYITEADRLLPPKIAAVTGRLHHMIKPGLKDSSRAEAYFNHAGTPVTTFPGGGFDHYVNGYWSQVGLGRTILDGQCYELAVNYHKNKFPIDFEIDHLRKFGFGINLEDYEELQSHWGNQIQDSSCLDRRDMIFWSGNINGVYAKMTQEHDLFVDLFYPACNKKQFDLLLSVPFDVRDQCLFQSTITKHINPDVDGIPYNPNEPFSKRAIKRIRNEIFKISGL